MWIRSQDKEVLINVNRIQIYDEGIEGNSHYDNDSYHLGQYKTKKRCLEILDEIREVIIIMGNVKITVYNMPKE